MAIELIWPAKGGRCRRMLCHYEVKCRKALWLQVHEHSVRAPEPNQSRNIISHENMHSLSLH